MATDELLDVDEVPPSRMRVMVHYLLRPAFSAWEFALDWWYTRNWRALLFGLPAVMVVLAALIATLTHASQSPTCRLEEFNAAGRAAFERDDLASAEVYFRRAAALSPSAPSAVYHLALIAQRDRDRDRALALMRGLAPEDASGFAAAHLWLAKDLVAQKITFTPETAKTLKHHLTEALRDDEGKAEAHAMLGRLSVLERDGKQAVEHFEQAVSGLPEVGLELARLYAATGRRQEALRAAKEAGEFFRGQAEAEPDQPLHRLRWGVSELIRGNFQVAADILNAGLSSPDPQPFRRALAATYQAWLTDVAARDKDDLATQLRLLDQVLMHDPGNARALTILADLSTRPSAQTDQAAALLQKTLGDQDPPAVVNMVLGTRELQRGNLERALTLLEQANAGNPRLPTVLNNLAWALANRNPPDLERALKLAQAARKISNHPEIPDTLGTILARLGRHEEAVVQMEIALRTFPGRPDIHRKLADLYEKLGDADLARAHREMADKTQEKALPE